MERLIPLSQCAGPRRVYPGHSEAPQPSQRHRQCYRPGGCTSSIRRTRRRPGVLEPTGPTPHERASSGHVRGSRARKPRRTSEGALSPRSEKSVDEGAMGIVEADGFMLELRADATDEPATERRHFAKPDGGPWLGLSVRLRKRGQRDVARGHGLRSERAYCGSSSPWARARLQPLTAAQLARSRGHPCSDASASSTVTSKGAPSTPCASG